MKSLMKYLGHAYFGVVQSASFGQVARRSSSLWLWRSSDANIRLLAICFIFAFGGLLQAAAPVITAQPSDITLSYGQQASLSVAASGTSLAYHWFAGAQGDKSTPVPGATNASYLTPGVRQSASYWVQVTNSEGAASSRTALVSVSRHTELCFTDFESATVGQGMWNGFDGWTTYEDMTNASGILQTNRAMGTGKAAYIGNGPNLLGAGIIERVFHFRPLGKAACVNYSMDFMITDSINHHLDEFDLTFYNSSNVELADVDFYNPDKTIYVSSDNEKTWAKLLTFVNSQPYHLWIGVDYSSNLWSAKLNNQTIFSNAVFCATKTMLDFSSLRVWWVYGDVPGDNCLMLDNLGIAVEGQWGPVFVPTPQTHPGHPQWNLFAPLGQNVMVQTSTNLQTWQTLTNIQSTDYTNAVSDAVYQGDRRYYRAVGMPQ